MTTNARIYYPIHAVGFAPLGTPLPTGNFASGTYFGAKGVQSVGFTTTFALEQVFQLGQLDLYENVENIPNIELTIQKIIDSTSLLEHLATPLATSTTLAGRYNDNRCMIAIAYYNINKEFASGIPLSTVVMSGMYISAINWSLAVQGPFTESISLVGNNKVWYFSPSGNEFITASPFRGFNGSESVDPGNLNSGLGSRRQHITMGAGGSLWPTEIPGISGVAGSGYNPIAANGDLGAHIQNVTISTDLGRTELFELGRKGPYFRYANFPTQVTCNIEVTASERVDSVNARESSVNLSNQNIKILLTDSTIIDLGTKNKLQSISVNGGDTGGGNIVITYSYQNFNYLNVTNDFTDPAILF